MVKILTSAFVLVSLLLTGYTYVDLQPPTAALLRGASDLIIHPAGFGYLSGFSSYRAPAAAYSSKSDQYLLVFENGEGGLDLDYWIASSGDPAGGYHEIQSDHGASNPDVVYDKRYDRFLVVWDELVCLGVPADCHYVIKGQLLHGGFKKDGVFASSAFTIASRHGAGIDMRQPAAAYNDIDYQYVVVFRYGQDYLNSYPSIHGQMLSASENEPAVLTEVVNDLGGFEIRKYEGGWGVRNPDVAWNSHGGTFMSVWQTSHDTHDDYISGRHLYDYYRSGFEQGYGGNAFMLAPFSGGTNPLENECSHPAIAYDPGNKNYVMVFQHREGDEQVSPTTIHAQRLNRSYDPTKIYEGYSFPVETDNSKVEYHIQPAIAYSGLGQDMYAVYASWDANEPGTDQFWLTERTLRGGDAAPRFKIRTAYPDAGINHPGVAGAKNGRALVVWDELSENLEHRGIKGVFIKPAENVYLPSVINK